MKNKTDWNKIAQHLEEDDSGEVDKQALEDSQFIWEKSAELGKKIRGNSSTPAVEEGMSKMYTRINSGSDSEEESKIVPIRRHGFMRYAAAAAIVFMLGYVVLKNRPINDGSLEANQKVYTNSTDNDQQIALVDGTQIKLATGSKLTHPESFDGETRVVQLKGTAFFDVKRDESKPFIILTKAANVQVLGTSFNLDAQQDQVKLDVKTGKVAFSNLKKDKLLKVTTNQKAVYDIEADELVKYISEGTYIKWNNKRIRLSGSTTLLDVTEVLEFRNKASFTFEDEELKLAKLAGSINPTDDAGDALRKLFQIHKKLKFVREGDKIHIKRRS